MSAPKVGDRVRIVIESTVKRVSERGWFQVELRDHEDKKFSHIIDLRPEAGTVSVEVLPPPEPDWFPPRHGDVAVTANSGGVVIYNEDHGRWTYADYGWYGGPWNTLTLLVRAGRSVQP